MLEKCQAALGDDTGFIRELGIPGRRQCIGQGHAKAPGQMVVAGPRLPQRRVARANRKMLARRLQFGRDLHDPLDHVGNARRRQPVIAVPSLLGDGQKAALRHARQMPACSLRRDPGHAREFGRRQGAALHQRVKHRRAGGIARHRGDFGKGCRTGHRLCFPPVGNHNAPFTGDASVLAVASLRALPVLGGAQLRNEQAMATTLTVSGKFHGWSVVGAAFVLAVFGWGLGFYGPPIYLQAVRDLRGWSLPLVSAAVTVHFLFGALAVARLPKLYLRYGLPVVTKAGAVSLAVGILGWAIATEPWQLFAAALFSGAGWVAMGAAAINAIVAPWFIRTRPAALAMAYNGASIGGVLFSPLWVAAIGTWGFLTAAAIIGLMVTIAVFILADNYFSGTPQQMGLSPDGDDPGLTAVSSRSAAAGSRSGANLWKDRGF